jgi:hypothetical protein
MMGLFGQEK